MEQFIGRRTAHRLDHLRPHPHSAGAAFLLANFRQGHVVMLFHDAIVVIHHVFRNLRDGVLTVAVQLREFPFRFFLLRLNFCALDARNLFRFFYQFFGRLDLPFLLLARHHLLEQPVFGIRDLFLAIVDFVLQRLKCLVGFHL